MRSFLITLKCLVPLAAVFLACPGEPEDPFFYSGTVYDETGAPLASATVRMGASSRDRACYGHEDFTADWIDSVETDGDGRYILRGMRYQVENPAHPRCVFIEATRADAGVTSFSTQGLATDTLVPPLLVWSVQDAVVSVADGEVRARPGSLPEFWPRDGGVDYYERNGWTIRASDRQVLWSAAVDGGELRLPTDVVESASGGELALEFAQYGMLKDRLIGASYLIRIRSPGFHLEPGRTPVSRGGRCTFGEAVFDPCVATDGEMQMAELIAPRESADHTLADPPLQFVIDLPRGPARVDRVALRGILIADERGKTLSPVLEGQQEDGGWVTLLPELPHLPSYYRSFDLPEPSPPVSRVRLRFATPVRVVRFAEELSVFGR